MHARVETGLDALGFITGRDLRKCNSGCRNRYQRKGTDVLIETCELRAERPSGDVERVCVDVRVGSKANGVVQVEVDGQCLAIIIIGKSKATADDGFSRIAEDGVKETLGIVRGPGKSDARLEIILVPVVHRLAAVCRAGLLRADGGGIVVALKCGGLALGEVIAEGIRRAIAAGIQQTRKHFEPFGFVDWAFEAVAKAGG